MSQKQLGLRLRELMTKVGITSFNGLAKKARVSRAQVRNIYNGKINLVRLEYLINISEALEISVTDLINEFTHNNRGQLPTIAAEYQKIQMELAQQRSQLTQEFQQEVLNSLESYLTYWPTAVTKVQENPQMLASKIIPLTKPIDQLISQWGITIIGQVGHTIAYNPQEHQLMEGSANPGDLVMVRYVGYRQGDRLIFRAKVTLP